MLKIFSKPKALTDFLSLNVLSNKLYNSNRVKNRSFLKNKLHNYFKSFELYKDLSLLKDGIKYIEFRQLFENDTSFNEIYYRELNHSDISQYFYDPQTQFITFPGHSTILKKIRNNNEEFLIENKIFLNRKMKMITRDIAVDVENTNLTINGHNNYENNTNKVFKLIGPLGCGKSTLLKLIRLYFIGDKSFVLYFDKLNLHKNYLTKFIQEVLFGFHSLLTSDVANSNVMDFEIIRDLYELYCYEGKENIHMKEMFKQMEKIIARLDKISKIYGTKFIIILDHLTISKQDNNDLLELFFDNKNSFIVITSFYDNFSHKNFLDSYEGKIPIKTLNLNFDLPTIKQLILENPIFSKYSNQYSVSQWNGMIKEFIDKRYFFELKKDVSKDFSFMSLIEYYTKLNPLFLNRLLNVMKEELYEIENDYVILDLIIDNYEHKQKIFVRYLIHDYIAFQITKGLNYNKLLETLRMSMQSQMKSSDCTPEIQNRQRKNSDMVCDNNIFYSLNQVVCANVPFVFEILSEYMKKNN